MSPIVLPSVIEGQSAGSDELALFGSGRAILGGVESYFVYGDLVMNDRKKIDTYIVKEIDGLADADVRDQREVVPQQHGEHAFTSYYGGRTIVLSGTIRAFNIHKLRDMQEALKSSFVSLIEKPLRIVSPFQTAPHPELAGELIQPSVQIMCKKSQPIAMRDVQANRHFTRDFQLTLRASNPFFTSEYQKSYTATTMTPPHGFTLTNFGNYKASPTIILTGPMTNPSLTNAANGDVLSITGTIPAANTWTFDIKNKSLKDQTGANKFSTLDVSSDWLTLEPADNVLTLTYTGGTSASSIQVTFNHTWV